MQFVLSTEQATEALAANIASMLQAPAMVYLQGDLGAGKTTLARALLQALGVSGRVKSPTYTLVEPYSIQGIDYYHFDLYRLSSPLELEAIGIQDYIKPNSICLVEWPEKGQGILPKPDLVINLQIDPHSETENGRICELHSANTDIQQKIQALAPENS